MDRNRLALSGSECVSAESLWIISERETASLRMSQRRTDPRDFACKREILAGFAREALCRAGIAYNADVQADPDQFDLFAWPGRDRVSLPRPERTCRCLRRRTRTGRRAARALGRAVKGEAGKVGGGVAICDVPVAHRLNALSPKSVTEIGRRR